MPKKYDCIQTARKFYPQMAKQGFTVFTHIDKEVAEDRLEEFQTKACGDIRFWDGNRYELTGEVIIGTAFVGRQIDGRVNKNSVPVFAKYKKANKKRKKRCR